MLAFDGFTFEMENGDYPSFRPTWSREYDVVGVRLSVGIDEDHVTFILRERQEG